jgi:hypothetical protein
MKSRRALDFLSVLLFVSLQFSTCANALPGEGTFWEPSSVPFVFVHEGRTLSGHIDYAVYDATGYPGTAPSGGEYIYAYQIHNVSSDVGVESFSVAIESGREVGGIGWDDPETSGGVVPSFEYFSPSPEAAENAKFLFFPQIGGLVESGQQSVLLLFGSDSAPTLGFGLIEGGSVGGIIEDLATPLPEPATIILLGLGGTLVALTRKRQCV